MEGEVVRLFVFVNAASGTVVNKCQSTKAAEIILSEIFGFFQLQSSSI